MREAPVAEHAAVGSVPEGIGIGKHGEQGGEYPKACRHLRARIERPGAEPDHAVSVDGAHLIVGETLRSTDSNRKECRRPGPAEGSGRKLGAGLRDACLLASNPKHPLDDISAGAFAAHAAAKA